MSDPQGVIAITDRGWLDFLRQIPDLAEANFWKPSARRGVRAAPYSPFLFKLKAPENAICGFGYFARYDRLPAWLAWDTFGQTNGCSSSQEMQTRISTICGRIRYQEGEHPKEIGRVLIAQPIFFPKELWVRQRADWPVRAQSEKWYSLVDGEGARVWRECLAAATRFESDSQAVAENRPRYGGPQVIRPRLGQGIFRVSITQAYSGACAVTGEHSLPALEASHIKPYGEGGPHEVPNGLLLRADLHRLFDKEYLPVTPSARIEVSNRLRTDFHNGKSSYPLHGEALRHPQEPADRPNPEFLRWHNENVAAA